MKRNLQITLCGIAVVLLTSVEIKAQKKLIHYWDFNSTTSCGAAGVQLSPLKSDYSALGHAYLVCPQVLLPNRDSIIDDGIGGTGVNARAILGNDTTAGTCHAGNIYVRERNPSSEDKFLWFIPTTKYKNIVITYSSERSGSGPLTQIYSYSLDSGATYITTGMTGATGVLPDSNAITTGWVKYTLDFTAITGANNNPKFVLKIVDNQQNTATNGNDRYDNVTVEGDSAITGIQEYANNLQCNIYPNPANEQLTITTPFDVVKTIVIYNSVGQVMQSAELNGKALPINISALAPGFYFMNIREVNGDERSSTLKFIKE